MGKINNSKCKLCLECEKVCPTGAITLFGEEYDAAELADILMQDKLFFKNSGGGVTLSGGECLFQPDFAVALAKILKENGISVYVDTCGFVSREVLKKIIPYTDKFLYDVKAIDSEVHKNCSGRDNAVILQNLEYLLSENCAVEIRYPLVVGYNDGECEKIGKWLFDRNATCKVKVLQYHPFASSRYKALGMENTLPNTKTEPFDVEKAVEILKSYGIPAINGITEQ
jgi:pyruvate formate lyase activating enzyme